MKFSKRARAIPICALCLFAGCAESPEEITDVAYKTVNSVLTATPTALPVGLISATRYGTVDIDTVAPGQYDYTLVSRDSITITADFANMGALANSARYKLWLRTNGETESLTGEFTQIRITTSSPSPGQFVVDTAVITGPVQSAVFSGGPITDVHQFDIVVLPSNAAFDGTAPYLAVSIEADASASTPSSAVPLWFQMPAPFDPQAPQGSVDHSTGTITSSSSGFADFGTFNMAAPGTGSVTHETLGSGLISVRQERTGAPFTALVGVIENLILPPVGYYYAAWLVGPGDGTDGVSVVSAGEVTTPPPASVSLRDVDRVRLGEEPSHVNVRSTGILEARTHVTAQEIGSAAGFGAFRSYYITLEPKLGANDVMGPGFILSASVPEAVVAASGQ